MSPYPSTDSSESFHTRRKKVTTLNGIFGEIHIYTHSDVLVKS